MSSLTLARRKVWLAQSPLSEPCRRTLRTLPVVPGELFGPVAQRALNRGIQANQTLLAFGELHHYQDSSLHKVMPPIVLCRQHVLVVFSGPQQLLSDPSTPSGSHKASTLVGDRRYRAKEGDLNPGSKR
ncbi:unnamed protein product [Arctogadus glacialis]